MFQPTPQSTPTGGTQDPLHFAGSALTPRTDESVDINSGYSHYLDPALSIEDRFLIACRELEIPGDQQARIQEMLAPLKALHPPTYAHCIRVGLLARELASFQNFDQKALFFAGVLHDCGKARCSAELLSKASDWTEADTEAMQEHVIHSHRMLNGRFDFSAEVILWHHRFQRQGYPTELPKFLHEYCPGTQALIPLYGRILALADSFDALHRNNGKFRTLANGLSGEEIKAKMLESNPDCQNLLESLFQSGILTTFIVGVPHAETEALDAADSLHASSFQITPDHRTPLSTRRFVELACTLEATSNKPGCTTRFLDASRHLRLPYFIVAGINIGEAMERLAGSAPMNRFPDSGLYMHAYEAQLESKRNRRGGRINHGMIELIVPIIIAQHKFDPSYKHSGPEILGLAKSAMETTSRRDVDWLVKLKHLAHQLSHYDGRDVPEHAEANNVYEYYVRDLAASIRPVSIAHNAEFVNGFPTVLQMWRVLTDCPYPHFTQKVEEAFRHGRLMHPAEVSSGFLADCVAAAIYLKLSQEPQLRLIG